MDIPGQGYCVDNRLCVWVTSATHARKKLVSYSFPGVIIGAECFLETAWLNYCSETRKSETAYSAAIGNLDCLPGMTGNDGAFIKRILRSTGEKPPTRNEMREFLTILEKAVWVTRSHQPTLRQTLLITRRFYRGAIDAWFHAGILDYRYHDIRPFLDPLPSDIRNKSKSLSSFEDPSSKAPGAITNLTFKTIEEARRLQGAHLDTRLAELQEKCFAALDNWDTRRSKLKSFTTRLSVKRYAEIQQVVAPCRLRWSKVAEAHAAVEALDAGELAAFYVAEFIENEFHVHENLRRFVAQCYAVYPHADRVVAYLSAQQITGFSSANRLINDLACCIAYFGPLELMAIQVLILSEAGFNPQPLRDLHISQCERGKGQRAHWKLMPVKAKTGKGQQQSVYADTEGLDQNQSDSNKHEYLVKQASKADGSVKRSAFDAMEMLMENYGRLADNWAFAPNSEGFLFTYPTRIPDTLAQRRFGTWVSAFNELKRVWDINPQYTLKQLRSQVGAQVVVRSNGNIYAVQTQLGHANIETSSGYVAHVMAGLDEAIINQFERQIAATIVFAIGGDDALYTRGLAREDVNTKTIPIITLQNKQARVDDLKHKLTPVGNGVGCTDPTDSPNQKIQPGDFCDGQQCYSCKHQKLLITEGRIKENILMLRYFRNNLETVFARNPEHWVKHGINTFAFQIALSHVIRSNLRYKSMYEKLERELAEAPAA